MEPRNEMEFVAGGDRNQSIVVSFLSQPATYGASSPVEIMETHISRIFLVGDRAYKTKKAVRLPYVDFSTPALRLAACRKEYELNRRTAPGLYLGVRRVTGLPGGELTFDGDGETVDAVVEMVRFEQNSLFDRMATAGTLTPALMTSAATAIARFHAETPVVHAGSGAANVASVLDINEAGFRTSHVFSETQQTELNAGFRAALSCHATLLDARERDGKIRRCHGDLHLRNLFVADGEPQIFDCIDFNDRLATIDVLYDLAFLLMDLVHRGQGALANLVANRYLDATGDDGGFCLLPFFIALRAAVRAHVTATAAEMSGDRTAREEADAYFRLAVQLLRPTRPGLIVVGGLSGSGKSTVAEALAPRFGPAPGARILESDRLRKAMHGVSAETRLDAAAYRGEISEKVYSELVARTGIILRGGGPVIVNAVFDRADWRARIAATALDLGVNFRGNWLVVDPETLRRRVAARTGGPSDATIEVLERQIAHCAPQQDWLSIDASRPASDVATLIGSSIGPTSGSHVWRTDVAAMRRR